jgi:hypothetical protein
VSTTRWDVDRRIVELRVIGRQRARKLRRRGERVFLVGQSSFTGKSQFGWERTPPSSGVHKP